MKIEDFKHWLNTNRTHDVSTIFHDLLAQVDQLIKERDDADRRAGAAERETAYSVSQSAAFRHWLKKAKKQWGVPDYVSFDKVWEEVLELKNQSNKS